MITIDPDTLIIGAPIAIGLVEVAKRAGLSIRYAPSMALISGFAAGVLMMGETIATTDGATTAVIIGLTAAGLYDQTKIIGPRVEELDQAA